MTIWTPHADWTRVNYAGPAVIAAGGTCLLEVASLFVPSGTAPAGGWPVCAMMYGGGFRFTACPTQIDSSAAEGTYELTAARLLSGEFSPTGTKYAVILAAFPIARGFSLALPTAPTSILFRGTYAATNVGQSTINSAGLTGGGSYVPSTTTSGGVGVNEVQLITASGTVSGGTYTITFAGQTTAPIAYNAGPTAIEAALVALSNVAPGDVFVYAGTKETGNPVDDVVFNIDGWSDTATFDHRYGPAYPGNGMAMPDTSSGGTFALPQYYGGSVHPARDPTRPTWMRASCMFAQWLWTNAPAMGLDRDRLIAGPAGSSPADVLSWTFHGPNRAGYHFPGGTGQDAVDTRIWRAGALRGYQPYLQLFPNSPTPCPTGTSCYISSIPRKPAGLGDAYSNYDQQSQALGQAPTASRGALSPLNYAQGVDVLAANLALPLWTDFSGADDVGAPYTAAQTATSGDIHSVWGGGAMRTLLTTHMRLVLSGDQGALYTGPVDAEFADNADRERDMVEFLDEWAAAIEPVEELAIRAVEDEIRTVTAANGYRTDIALVQRAEDVSVDLRQYPAVMTTAINATYDDSLLHPSVVGTARLAATLVLLARDPATRRVRVSRMIADIRKALQLRLIADQFDAMVHDIRITGSRRFLNENLTPPITGAVLDIEVQYRDLHSDPYTPR